MLESLHLYIFLKFFFYALFCFPLSLFCNAVNVQISVNYQFVKIKDSDFILHICFVCRCLKTLVSAQPRASLPSPPLGSIRLVLEFHGCLPGPKSASQLILTALQRIQAGLPTATSSSTAKRWTGTARPAALLRRHWCSL